MDIAEIEERFASFKPTRKTSTNHQYGIQISKLTKDLSITDVSGLLITEPIMEYVKSKSFSSQANAHNSIMEYLKTYENKDYDETIEYHKKQKDLCYEVYYNNNKKGIFIGNQAQNVVSYDEMINYYKQICKIVISNDYKNNPCVSPTNGSSSPARDYLNLRLLVRLYILHPSRNEYATLELISPQEFQKIQYPMKNYLIYSPKKGSFLSINVYKMMDKYGPKMILIEDKELKSHIRFHKNKFGYGHMFLKQNMKPHTNTTLSVLMTHYAKKLIGKSVGSTLIYKISIAEISKKYKQALEDEDLDDMSKYKEDLQKFADTRGHSFSVQQAIYAKE